MPLAGPQKAVERDPRLVAPKGRLAGRALQPMLLGVLVGTYSSIFIAAPLLGYLGVRRDWSGAASGAGKPSARRREAVVWK